MPEIIPIGEFLKPFPAEIARQSEKRSILINQLDHGLIVLVNNQEIKFGIEHKLQNDVYINFFNGDQKLGWVGTMIEDSSKIAHRLGKYYEDCPDNFKKQGLITAATALLFQFLIQEGYPSAEGYITKSNVESLRTRLRAPDLIRGGYFKSTLDVADFTPGSVKVTTDLSQNIPVLIEPQDELLLLQEYRQLHPRNHWLSEMTVVPTPDVGNVSL